MFLQFHFSGFSPEDRLKCDADQSLDRILGHAPDNSTAAALIEKTGDFFRCAVDIYSPQGPFISSGSGSTAKEALEHVEKAMIKKLDRWQSARGKRVGSRKEIRRMFSVA